MKRKIQKIIQRYGKQICAMAMTAGTLSVSYCRTLFYEPKQPDNFQDFLEKRKKE